MNHNLIIWLTSAFVTGLSVGAVCVGICGGVLFPLVFTQKKSLAKNLLILLNFSLGRLLAYIIFGAGVAWLGSHLTAYLNWITPTGYLLAALLLLRYISVKRTCESSKRFSHKKLIPFFLGIITGFNFCPPFILAMATAANAGGAVNGALYFAAFFFGTSVYLIPFPFLGGLAKWELFKRFGKFAGIIVAFIYIFVSLNSFHLLLYPPSKKSFCENLKVIPPEYKNIFPSASKIKKEKNVFLLYSTNEFLGSLVDSRALGISYRGYGGQTPLIIFRNKDREKYKIKILPNNETPQFLNYVLSSKWWKTIEQNPLSTKNVDSVTGATMTSESLRRTLLAAINTINNKQITRSEVNKSESIIVYLPVAFLLIFSVLIYKIKFLRRGWIEWLIWLFSIFFLGFYQVNYFSISGVGLPVKGGLPEARHIAWYLIFIFALVSPLFFGRVYCRYVCPFGALTEILYKIVPVKIIFPAKILKILLKIKFLLLIAAAILIVVLPDFPIDKFEPFQAIFMRNGGRMYLIFALVVLFFSCFIKRFWCNIFCVDGALFDTVKNRDTDFTDFNGF